MLLVDTSVWVDHLRHTDPALQEQLRNNNVLIHPMVVGELAMGQFPSRTAFFADVLKLPVVAHASHREVLEMIEIRRLFGRGIGFIDCHLLASARIGKVQIWSRDRRFMTVAAEMGVAFHETKH